METLTLKQLAPYLLYGLRFVPVSTGKQYDAYDMIASIYSEGNYQYDHDFTEEQFMNMPLKQSRITFIEENNGEVYLGEMEHEKGFIIDDVYLSDCKPLLRPLYDLTKEIEHNGETFVVIDILEQDENNDYLADCNIWTQKLFEEQKIFSLEFIPYGVMQILFKYHFDVFGLIPRNLALDINQIK